MKRHIKNLLIAILAVTVFPVVAKNDTSEGDWDDEGPGIVISFINPPVAEFSGLQLHLTTTTGNVTIWWTTNSEALPDDGDAWTQYTGPVTLTEDCTVRFFASNTNGARTSVGSYAFVYADHQTEAPSIATDTDGKVITMSCATPGASIRYTTDGSEPDENSSLYTGPVSVKSHIYHARAFADNLFPSETVTFVTSFTAFSVPVPTATVEDLCLVLSCEDTDATILYTFDTEASTDNEESWQTYSAPVKLIDNDNYANCIVRYFARKEDCTDSDVATFTFLLTNYRAVEPTIERNEGGTHIVMETPTENGEIRYTTDDTEPTEESTLYTGPILIDGNFTYTAKTFAHGYLESKPNRYVITNMAAPAPSVLFVRRKFSLSCLDPRAQIWYTTDPDAAIDGDMTGWTLYTGPFELTEDCILRSFSRRDNFHDSNIESLTFVLADYQCMAPRIMRNEQGTHVVMTAEEMSPTLGSILDDDPDNIGTSGTVIRYTTDGSVPTEESDIYQNPLLLSKGMVFKARTFDTHYYASEITEYAIGNSSTPAPTADFRHFAVNLSCDDADASIWYTTDPDATLENLDDWTLYNEPIKVKADSPDCTYRFFAGDDDDNASDIQSYVYQKADHTVTNPTIECSLDGANIVMATAIPYAHIRYTTDGSEPTEESTLYVTPFLIPGNFIFRAKAFAAGMFDSETVDFIVNNMSSQVAYASVDHLSLLLTCDDIEATIWYTTDETATPDDAGKWTLYEAPIPLVPQNTTYHFITRRVNFKDSDIETFVVLKANYQAATPSVSRTDDGNYLIMECATEGAELRYTTDGSDPDNNSELYRGILFPRGYTNYRVRAFSEGLFASEIAEYTVSNHTVIEPVAVFENLMLTIKVDDPDAQIWHSVDHRPLVNKSKTRSDDDDTQWLLYKEPVSFEGDGTVKFFASKPGSNNSAVITYEHVYAEHQVSAPEFQITDDQYATITCGDESAQIRYTLDGTEPTESSPLYEEPIQFKPGKNNITARAFDSGKYPSDIANLNYDYVVTGISGDKPTGDSVRFIVRYGIPGFEADSECRMEIYSDKGILVLTIDLNEGFNALPALPSGVYVTHAGKIII